MKRLRTLFVALAVCAVAFGRPAAAAEQRAHDTDVAETLAPGTTLEIDNVAGSIVATQAGGDTASIHAHATSRDVDPATATIRTIRTPGRVRVCVTYPGDDAAGCDARGRMRHSGNERVSVDFTVAVPPNVKLVANSVEGNVRALGLRNDISVAAVEGDVSLATSGHAEATVVDGALDVRLSATSWGADASFRNVNGSIHLTLPRGANASLTAATLNGSIHGERGISMTTSDGYVGHTGSATLGSGGSHIALHTVNGDIAVGFN